MAPPGYKVPSISHVFVLIFVYRFLSTVGMLTRVWIFLAFFVFLLLSFVLSIKSYVQTKEFMYPLKIMGYQFLVGKCARQVLLRVVQPFVKVAPPYLLLAALSS